MKTGYYWVQKNRNDETMTIAKLTKNSGWKYIEEQSIIMTANGMNSKNKPARPARIIMRVQTPDAQKYYNPLADCTDWSPQGEVRSM